MRTEIGVAGEVVTEGDRSNAGVAGDEGRDVEDARKLGVDRPERGIGERTANADEDRGIGRKRGCGVGSSMLGRVARCSDCPRSRRQSMSDAVGRRGDVPMGDAHTGPTVWRPR